MKILGMRTKAVQAAMDRRDKTIKDLRKERKEMRAKIVELHSEVTAVCLDQKGTMNSLRAESHKLHKSECEVDRLSNNIKAYVDGRVRDLANLNEVRVCLGMLQASDRITDMEHEYIKEILMRIEL